MNDRSRPVGSIIRTIAEIGPCVDQLVGAGKQEGRHSDAERLRGFEIDDQFEFGRLFDRS